MSDGSFGGSVLIPYLPLGGVVVRKHNILVYGDCVVCMHDIYDTRANAHACEWMLHAYMCFMHLTRATRVACVACFTLHVCVHGAHATRALTCTWCRCLSRTISCGSLRVWLVRCFIFFELVDITGGWVSG